MTPEGREFVKQMIEKHEEAIREHTAELKRYQSMWRTLVKSDLPVPTSNR